MAANVEDSYIVPPGKRFQARRVLGLPLDGQIVAISRPDSALPASVSAGSAAIVVCSHVPALPATHAICFDFAGFAPGRALLLQACDVIVLDAASTALDMAEAAASGTTIVHAQDAEMILRQDGFEYKTGQNRPEAGGQSLACALSLFERLPPGLLTIPQIERRDAIGIALPASRRPDPTDPVTPEWRAIRAYGVEPALLVAAPYSGQFVLQLMLTAPWDDRSRLCVNGSAIASMISRGDADARFDVHLRIGINRIALVSPTTSAIAAVSGTALWPARRRVADAIPDGLFAPDIGLQTREPPDLASLLPAPFYRAVARHNLAWLASSFAGTRQFLVKLRNPFPNQRLRVRVGGEVVSTSLAKEKVADMTMLICSGRFDRGFNPILISPSVLETDSIGRPLAFYLESIELVSQLPDLTDLVCWDVSSGFGELEAPVESQDLSYPFRWMQAARATIVLDRLEADRVRITLHSRFLGPQQTVDIQVNGALVTSEAVQGDDLLVRRPIILIANLSKGINEIVLDVDQRGAHDAEKGRDLYLLLERIDIEAI